MATWKCPACRSQIDTQAVRCPMCRHDLTPAQQADAARAGLVSTAMRFGIIMLGVLAVGWCSTSKPISNPDPMATAAALPVHTQAERDRCGAFISKARKAGLVASLDGTRINVNEGPWLASKASVKRALVQSAACNIWGTDLPPSGEYVVVYGEHSGRRMAMLTEVGMSFE